MQPKRQQPSGCFFMRKNVRLRLYFCPKTRILTGRARRSLSCLFRDKVRAMENMKSPTALRLFALGLSLCAAAGAQAQIYRCPNNEYTNDSRIAQNRGCKPLEGGNVTVIHGATRNAAGSSASNSAPKARGNSANPPTVRPASVSSSAEQRARDADSRRILQAELDKAQQKLTGQQQEYKNGQPDRLGNERNYQKYLDRVAEMKAGITRTENDIAGLKREIGRLPPASASAM